MPATWADIKVGDTIYVARHFDRYKRLAAKPEVEERVVEKIARRWITCVAPDRPGWVTHVDRNGYVQSQSRGFGPTFGAWPSLEALDEWWTARQLVYELRSRLDRSRLDRWPLDALRELDALVTATEEAL